ncbi:low temperature requirement protein A [Variovorax ginsengisoli]|uniref:Low temperature requirement protein A n=1 Tax=Variovorax ginsengisoli TaxID=363844 RepID=A0ABT8SFZ8_9BURK|nr:low temperature requirement protein A [Variovorax ginsengisoli]MDN8618679.1 low temperature requirement protein A [Variovorax ginsengisoli]MDO1537849.1 low temperature requirement protein A [Variovorax ginsengisoli]
MKDLRYFDPHRRATWLELFFDLIFVVALHAAGEILSEAHEGHIGVQQFLHFVLVFLPLWWIWAGHTIYANRFDTDSRQHRLSTLLIMLLLIVISAQSSAGAQEHYALAVVCYCGARLIISGMYFFSRRKHHDGGGFASTVGTVFAVGAAISLSSVLMKPPWRYLVFYAGIVFEMAALVLRTRRLHVVPAHTAHLVERVGCLTIIMLGESVISISAALTGIAWNGSNVIAAVSGFVMVSAIWWIYYDSFHLLEQRKLATGLSILYSHFFLFIGLAILASLIRHAILDDLDPGDFRRLAAAGTVLFFLGKQYGYYMEVPELRPYLLSNTAAVFALTALVLMLPLGVGAMLVGITATMICYVLLNLRYRHLVRGRKAAA